MGKLDKLKSQIPQGSQELSTKNHLAKTEIAMSFQNEGTELTRILLRNIEFNPHNLWSCNDDDESIKQLADAIERNGDRKSTRLNSSHIEESRMPSSA